MTCIASEMKTISWRPQMNKITIVKEDEDGKQTLDAKKSI